MPRTAHPRRTYIHHVPGRLRVRDPRFRGNASRAADRLRLLRGVKTAIANEVTGSLTVHYDPSLTTRDILLRRLRIEGARRPPSEPRPEGADRLLRTVALFALEKAAEQSLAALFAAVL